MAIFRRELPLTGASNAGGVGINRNIWLHCVLWTIPAASAIHLGLAATDHGEFMTLVAGKRLSLLMVGNNDEVYDKKPQRCAC